jgi:hypothetical protein
MAFGPNGISIPHRYEVVAKVRIHKQSKEKMLEGLNGHGIQSLKRSAPTHENGWDSREQDEENRPYFS